MLLTTKKNEQNVSMPQGWKHRKRLHQKVGCYQNVPTVKKWWRAWTHGKIYIMQLVPERTWTKGKKGTTKSKKENFVFLITFFFSFFYFSPFSVYSFCFFFFFFVCKRRLSTENLFKWCISSVLDFQKGKFQEQNCWYAAYFEVRVKKWISTLVFLLPDLQLLKF